jgi:hypothetical protein
MLFFIAFYIKIIWALNPALIDGKTAYIVGDKLFITGSLWKG